MEKSVVPLRFSGGKRILLCAVFFSLIAAAHGQNLPGVTIVNNTGFTVYYVYISQTASQNWGTDTLGSSVLSNGSSTSVRLPYPLNVVNRYDIKLVDKDGDSYIKWDVPVTANASIVFTFNDFVSNGSRTNTNTNSAPDLPYVTIVNNTGFTVWYVYVSQTASENWGSDTLGSNVIINGSSANVQLPYPINVVNRYDIKLVDKDGDSYIKWNVLVTANGRIVFTFSDYVSNGNRTNTNSTQDLPLVAIVHNTE